MKFLLLLACTAILGSGFAERRRYDGYQIWETAPKGEQYKVLQHLYEEGVADVMGNEILVSPDAAPQVFNFLDENLIPYIVQNENIQLDLEATWARLDKQRAYDPNDYNTYDDIISELNRLASEDCPSGFTCNTYSIGTTLGGRDIRVLSVTQGSGRQALWFDSLIHAREWLAGATMMRFTDKLLNDYGSDADASFILDNYDYYYLAVHNPDGYAYTFSSDRFWRKNRRPNDGSACVGVDLNRNFDYVWSDPGASSNPCAETFYGPSVASEAETTAVQDEATSIPNLVAFTTVHTVVPAWLYPYGDCRDPPNSADLHRVGVATVDAIEATHNTNWALGNSCRTLGQTSGCSDDWARSVGIPYSSTPELRGPGFNPPASAIQPSHEEMWNGFVAMVREIDAIGKEKRVA